MDFVALWLWWSNLHVATNFRLIGQQNDVSRVEWRTQIKSNGAKYVTDGVWKYAQSYQEKEASRSFGFEPIVYLSNLSPPIWMSHQNSVLTRKPSENERWPLVNARLTIYQIRSTQIWSVEFIRQIAGQQPCDTLHAYDPGHHSWLIGPHLCTKKAFSVVWWFTDYMRAYRF